MGKVVGVAYITEPSVVKIHAGVVNITDISGTTKLRRAMSVRILQANVERCQRALERYGRGETSVIVDD